jgi:hypothetical protein
MPMSRRSFGALLIGVPVIGIPALGPLPPAPKCDFDFRMVPLSQLRCRTPGQLFNDETIRQLADSIEGLGLMSHLTVALCADGFYEVINGGHRYHALHLINYRELVPVYVIPWSSVREYINHSSDIRSMKCNVEHS